MTDLTNRTMLLIGVGRYRHLAPVAAARRDAAAIGDLLHRSGDFSPATSLLRDQTRASALRPALRDFLEDLDAPDAAVVFFAGHGELDRKGRLVLMPSDAAEPREGIHVDDMLAWARDAGLVVFILDCCHAGAAIEPALTLPHAGSLAVIAACHPTATARAEGEHGVLTAAILDAIEAGHAELSAVLTAAAATCKARRQAAVVAQCDRHGGFRLVDPLPPGQSPAPTDPLKAWRACMREAHTRLVPFFDAADAHLATENVIQVEVAPCGDGPEPHQPRLHRRAMTLRQLLDQPTDTAPRWVVLGEPGAGKSTLARHLTWSLSAIDAPPDTPVPVLLSLARLMRTGAHPFDLAERDLRQQRGHAASRGLAARLRRLAERPDKPTIWLLLDGFDEVPEELVEDAIAALGAWQADLPHVTIAVLSRPVGWPANGVGGVYRPAKVESLGPGQQRTLLRTWLGHGKGEAIWQRIHTQRALADLSRNPLMLTLLAVLSGTPDTLPPSRSELYDRAIERLLARGHGPRPGPGVASTPVARQLLRALSLALSEQGDITWSRDALVDTAHAALDADDALGRRCGRTWPSIDAALADIAHNSGILAPHDGPNEGWRYLHRSLRERLAAEAIAAGGTDAVLERIGRLAEGDDDALGQWGETLGMACGLLDDPLAALHAIRARDAMLALRVLEDVDAVAPEDAMRFIEAIDEFANASANVAEDLFSYIEPIAKRWDGDTLVRAVGDRPKAAEVLWARVTPGADLDELSWLHYAPTAVGGAVEQVRFFGACDRWPRDGAPEPALVDIPAGTFTMGTSASERATLPEKWQGPEVAHRVTLTAGYRLGRCPVTVAEYLRFDPTHECGGGHNYPVTCVSWWRARLYAAWVGCVLPTEAQWERACRAGTQTRYWSGDGEANLSRVGWCDGNPFAGWLYPVGEKPVSPFGLHDMHGNVWEWCADWFEAYPPGPAEDPLGPPAGEFRLLRGGSSSEHANSCRSASRNRAEPGLRDGAIGFRLARPALFVGL